MGATTTQAALIAKMKTGTLYRQDFQDNLLETIRLPIMNDTDFALDESSVFVRWVAPAPGSILSVACDLDSGGLSADDEATLTIEVTKDDGTGPVTVFTANPEVHWDDDAYVKDTETEAISFGTGEDDATGITAGVLKTDGTEDFVAGDTLYFSAIFDQVTAIDTPPKGLRAAILVQFSA